MKKTILLFLSICVLFTIQAQKAKLKNASITYMHYPSNPLSMDIKTYAVNVTNTSTRIKIGGDRERQYLVLEGFEKVTPDKADIMLNFELYGVQTNADVLTKEETTKVDGKDVKKIYYYHEVVSTASSKFSIVDKAGKIIYTQIMQGKDYENRSQSSYFNTRAEAEADYNKNKDGVINSSDNATVGKILSAIYDYINNNYGYYKVNSSVTIATGKGKDSEYADADEAVVKFEEAVNLYNMGKQEEYNKIAMECIAIWEKILEEYDPNNKKARISKKNADSFFYNISNAYLYMNEFDKAIEYINKGLEVDNSVFVKMSINDIKDRQNRYLKNLARK
jgi:tetratricopeptide (TPR) repeat protein